MLNPFPELLSFSLAAPVLLRLIVSIIFVRAGVLKVRNTVRITNIARGWGLVEIVFGLLLFVGLWTQVAAIVLAILTIAALVSLHKEQTRPPLSLSYQLLLLAILLSLVVTGAGFLAFDLPL